MYNAVPEKPCVNNYLHILEKTAFSRSFSYFGVREDDVQSQKDAIVKKS